MHLTKKIFVIAHFAYLLLFLSCGKHDSSTDSNNYEVIILPDCRNICYKPYSISFKTMEFTQYESPKFLLPTLDTIMMITENCLCYEKKYTAYSISLKDSFFRNTEDWNIGISPEYYYYIGRYNYYDMTSYFIYKNNVFFMRDEGFGLLSQLKKIRTSKFTFIQQISMPCYLYGEGAWYYNYDGINFKLHSHYGCVK